MNVIPHVVAASCVLAVHSHAQTLQNPANISVYGKFKNVVAESAASTFIIDDQLGDGYTAGSDLFGAPAALLPTAENGNAFFQWGTPESTGDHSSALWFQRLYSGNVTPETTFNLGYLFFRNGSITDGTGITEFDLEFALIRPVITTPNNINPTYVSYATSVIDTPDTGSAVENADLLVLQERFYQTPFKDEGGKTYFVKVGFANPTDGASTPTSGAFSVPEGSVGKVTVTAMYTTVPEPSAAILGALGALALLRRRR